jgi:hypothetical protein
MSDTNLINMTNLSQLKSGDRTAYMADLYDTTLKGLGGAKRLEIETFEPKAFPLATLFMEKAKQGGNKFARMGGKSWWYEWGEDATPSTILDRNVVVHTASIDAAAANTNATETVVSTAGVKEGDMLIAFGEETTGGTRGTNYYFIVTKINSATSLDIKTVNVLGFDIVVTQKLYVIGSAYAEMAGVTDPMYTNPVTKYGEAQIFKNSFRMSRRQKSFTTAYGDDYYYQMIKTARDHKYQIELALLMGYRPAGFDIPVAVGSALEDASGRPVTLTMGLEQAIGFGNDTWNASSGNGSRKIAWTRGNGTIEDFEASMDALFEYKSGGSGTKYMFGGLGVKSYLRSLARDSKIQVMSSQKTPLGITVNKIETDAGALTFIEHPMMKGVMKDSFYIIDPSCVETHIVAPTAMHEQGKGTNSEISHFEFITDLGLAVKNVNLHASGVIL